MTTNDVREKAYQMAQAPFLRQESDSDLMTFEISQSIKALTFSTLFCENCNHENECSQTCKKAPSNLKSDDEPILRRRGDNGLMSRVVRLKSTGKLFYYESFTDVEFLYKREKTDTERQGLIKDQIFGCCNSTFINNLKEGEMLTFEECMVARMPDRRLFYFNPNPKISLWNGDESYDDEDI